MLIEFVASNGENFSFEIIRTSYNLSNGNLTCLGNEMKNIVHFWTSGPEQCIEEMKEHLMEQDIHIIEISNYANIPNLLFQDLIDDLPRYN